MSPRGQFQWGLLSGLLAVCLPARAGGGQADLVELRRKRIDAQLALVRLEAEESVLELESTLLAGEEPIGPRDRIPEGTRERLAAIFQRSSLLKDSRQRWTQAVAELRLQAANEEKQAEAAWRKAMNRELDVRQRWAEATVRLERSPGQTPPLLPVGPARARLLLWAAVALATGLMLAVHEIRRERRRRRSLGDKTLGWLLGLAAMAGLGWWIARQVGELREAHEPILWAANEDRSAVLHRLELQKELDRAEELQTLAQEKNRTTRARIEQKRAELYEAWARRLGFPTGQAFRGFEGDLVQRLHPLLVAAHTAEILFRDAGVRSDKAGRQDRVIHTSLAEADDRLRQRAVVRTALGVLALLGAVAPWLVVRAGIARRRRIEIRRCPRCGGKLRLERPGGAEPAGRHVSCQACKFRFPAVYRWLRRLSFSTLGVCGSGKTLWFLEAYHLLSRHTVPPALSLDPIPNVENQNLDAALEALHHSGQVPGSTRHPEDHLPCPVLFHFRDRDRDDPGVMVNLFDLAGETAEQTLDQGGLRRWAPGMDGLIFILDPTGPWNVEQPGVDRQRLALEGCVAEIRQAHGIPAGQALSVPVAVCLSKLDLLPTRSLYETASLEWLDRLRRTDTHRPDLQTLCQRSALVREVLPGLFPGWNLAQVLEHNFGHNVLFFPLTPVGLDDNETLLGLGPGAESLRDRAMTSFGVVEPLLWLLHVHGYRVFE